MSSGIQSFVHCATCFNAERRERLKIGLIDPITVRIWCQTCDKLVVDFEITKPRELRCDICGGLIGPNHRH